MNHKDILKKNIKSFETSGETTCSYGMFDRYGGVSSGEQAFLNTSFGVGDRENNVGENRKRVSSAMSLKSLISAKQVHGNEVYVHARTPHENLEVTGYDALVTNLKGAGLMIQQADCQAVLLYDDEEQVIGAIHSGWRGSVANISGKTIDIMSQRFGTLPQNIHAVISPSLGPCCAEFINYKEELPPAFTDFMVKPNYIDFWAITRFQLECKGVKPENILVNGNCTCCSEDYFSYRRACRENGGVTGRNCSVIVLR